MIRRCAALGLGVLLIAGSRPAFAASSLSISSVTTNGSRVSVAGSALLGDDVTGPHVVLTDPVGDDAAGGLVANGLDIVSAGISRKPGGPLVFAIDTANMPPVLDSSAPTFVFNWMVAVDGVDAGYYVQAGFVGGWPDTTTYWYGGATLNPGPFFNVCQRVPAGIGCTSLGPNGGAIGGNRVEIRVPLLELAAKPGSAIWPGTGGGTDCSGICSTWQPYVAVLHNAGGDQAEPDPFVVPGGVQLTAVDADDEDSSIDWSGAVVAAIQTDGRFAATFTPSVPLAQARIAVRACGGSVIQLACVATSA